MFTTICSVSAVFCFVLLAHLNGELLWSFLIGCRPSVNFYNINRLLKQWTNFNQTECFSSSECPDGLYGRNCAFKCVGCMDPGSCDKIAGDCNGMHSLLKSISKLNSFYKHCHNYVYIQRCVSWHVSLNCIT